MSVAVLLGKGSLFVGPLMVGVAVLTVVGQIVLVVSCRGGNPGCGVNAQGSKRMGGSVLCDGRKWEVSDFVWNGDAAVVPKRCACGHAP